MRQAMPLPPGLPARRAALRLLDAVLRRGLTLESALDRAADGLPHADRALTRAIVSSALRWLPDLDALIDSATRNRLADDAKARAVLRLALAQALVLKTPGHAVVATALPLVEGGPRRLVHGVLGTLLRREPELPETPNLPAEVEARWQGQYGEAMVADARATLAAPPPLDMSLRDPSGSAAWAMRLDGQALDNGQIRLPAGTDVATLPGFEEGAWWVQNRSAAAPARWFGTGEGRALLDLCAAPGGKTMQLAVAGWRVTAVDREAARLGRVRDNLARTGLDAELIAADLENWSPPRSYPAILLDAPCSATGTFARHPEVLYRARPKDIAAFAETQSRMIARAAEWLEPGGVLVYAVCSLETAEGEGQVAAAEAAGLTLDRQERILPAPGRDGFFIARFCKP
jgi:16S rRNA (cytosine967-C5)-methyltransferase